MRLWWYLLPVAAMAVFVAAIVSLIVFHGPRAVPDPLAAYRPCVPAVALGPEMVVCANLHSYHRQDGSWIDLGLVTPLPKVPRD